MDPVWKELPVHLAEHICNQLPKVRRLPMNLKREIESQRFFLAKSYTYYLRLCEFHSRAALSRMMIRTGNHGDLNDVWRDMSPEARLEFYYGSGGPGTTEAKIDLECQEMFREWREYED